jgi:hypothetical protein
MYDVPTYVQIQRDFFEFSPKKTKFELPFRQCAETFFCNVIM